MLTEKMIYVGFAILNSILDFLDALPQIPDEVVSVLNQFFDLVFVNGWNAACFFVPMDFVLILVPLVILVDNFEHVYHLIMWVLRKIPLLGIE